MAQTQAKIPLWLDCDPGHDDACAILLAAWHPAFDLLGISTVNGNATLSNVTQNALSMLEAIGRPDVPVYTGADRPFCRPIRTAPEIHGAGGLAGTDLLPVPRRKSRNGNAVNAMRDALMACPPDSAWLVATGPLTNAAMLFNMYPEVADHIKGFSLMGGAIGNKFAPSVYLGPPYIDKSGKEFDRCGNYTHFAEFNVWADPESAGSVFANRVLKPKLAVIPLDVSHQAYTTRENRKMLLEGTGGPTRMRKMFNELFNFVAGTYEDAWGMDDGAPLHDPLAVAILLAHHPDPESRISFDDNDGERWDVEVTLSGLEEGRTVARKLSHGPGTFIPRSLDTRKFWSVLDMCMAKADEATGFVKAKL